MSDIIERARAIRAGMEEVSAALSDERAVELPEFFPAWNPDSFSYSVGDRVRYNGTLHKVLQAHTSQPGWNPADAPSLFAEVLPEQDGTEIGVWEQPDSTNTYMTGNRVHYPTLEDPIYESLIDNNSWSPGDYPQGWRLVEE